MTRAVRLDEELEQRAQRVRELERLADDEHKKAQAFNKAQRSVHRRGSLRTLCRAS